MGDCEVEDALLSLTADIVAAPISNNKVTTGDVPSVITTSDNTR